MGYKRTNFRGKTINILFVSAITSAHKITQLKVPLYADPRRAAELSCHFQMDDQKLHSVKWYRDMNEIFRYNPSQKVSFDIIFSKYTVLKGILNIIF